MFLQLLQRNADFFPHGTAISFGDRSISHSAFLLSVERRARDFLSRGLSAGDRVALIMENSPEYIETFFAIAACRAVSVPLSPELKVDELNFFLSNSGARLIVTDAQRLGRARKAASDLPWQVDVARPGLTEEKDIKNKTLRDDETDGDLPSGRLDDDLIYLYSSGTTGRPKCAPRTVVQYWWEMTEVIHSLKLVSDDVIFCALPLYHNYGSVQCMLSAVGAAARLVILRRTIPFKLHRKQALNVLQKEQVTVFPGVPFMFDNFVESSASVDLSKIRLCYSAAAALSQKTAQDFRDRFGVPIRNHYGCTEAGAIAIDLDADPGRHKQSVGQAFKGVQVRIVDSEGQDVQPGGTGEILVRCRAMTRGYIGENGVDTTAFTNGFFRTGDLGRLDADGELYLLGRTKNIIDVVGQKFSPVEVEDVLLTHPAICDSIVFGVPSPDDTGQSVFAYVVSDGSCTAKDLFVFCSERLANFKVPETFEFISCVPRDTLGKAHRDRTVVEGLVKETGKLAAPK